jgi:hypothetical protein
MQFQFVFGDDGTLEVTGTPALGSQAELFHRSGQYEFSGNEFVSPAINEGQPVLIRVEGDSMVLTIDDNLKFRLRRT